MQIIRRHQHGFSLIEMVIVIVLMGIMGATVAVIIDGPVRGYVQAEQRAELVDLADTALTRMTRELRLAVPNSIRITTAGNRTSVEFLRVFEGGRYRALPGAGLMPACGAPAPGAGDPLEFSCADARFDVLGQLRRAADIQTGADCANNIGYCLSVFNTGQAGANIYAGEAVASILSIGDNAADDGSDQLTLSNASLSGGGAAFGLASPGQRFYIMDTPVSYVCDTDTGTVTRHAAYPIAAVQSTAPGGNSDLLVSGVSQCVFTYNAGTHTRGGISTLRLSLRDTRLNEQVDLIQQVHVQNLP